MHDAPVVFSEETIETTVKSFEKQVRERWNAAHRSKSRFECGNRDWLQEKIFKPSLPIQIAKAGSSRGRGKQPKFSTLSVSQRRKRTKSLTDNEYNTSSQLLFAARKKLKEDNQNDEVEVLKLLEEGKATELLHHYRESQYSQIGSDTALNLIVNGNLSVRQYSLLRSTINKSAPQILPVYHQILEAKKTCYPDGIVCKETEVLVNLHALLEKTASRLLETLPEEKLICSSYTLLCKWGFDGSSGQSEYKQIFSSSSATDSSVVITTLVPIRLVSDTNDILWENTQPSSTAFCRPIRMSFEKETVENIRKEKLRMDTEIAALEENTILHLSSNKVKQLHNKLKVKINFVFSEEQNI